MAEKVKNKSNFVGKFFKVLFNIVIFLVCLIALVLVIYVFSAQVNKNNKSYKPFLSFYTIVSPSMNPVIKVYDVVVNTKVNKPEDIEIGDIITYISTNSTSEGMTITHRVVAISKTKNGNYEYQTQGDNNSEPDGVLVTFDNVIGKEIFIIPKLGKLQFLLANKKGWFLLLLIPILIFVFKDLYDLIDLFGLRRKVDDVAGLIEEPVYVKKNNLEVQQKEILKRELSIHNVKEDAAERREAEGEGFLEPYSESIVEVGKPITVKKNVDVEVEPIKLVKPDKIEGKEIIPDTDDDEVNEKIREIMPVLAPVEVLDTDELTSKIKDYDDKISKLNEMLIDLAQLKINKEKEIIVEKEKASKEIAKEKEEARKEIEKEKNSAREEIENIKQDAQEEAEKKEVKTDPKKIIDNYLIGRKIKVVKSVEAKKRISKKQEDDKKVVLGNKKENINTRLVIERPKAVDLPKIREMEKEEVVEKQKPKAIIDNRNLKLKDNKVSKKKKTISSADVVLKELNTINKKEDSNLMFNPKMVKKVDSKKDDKKSKPSTKKRGLIYIEKEKNKGN